MSASAVCWYGLSTSTFFVCSDAIAQRFERRQHRRTSDSKAPPYQPLRTVAVGAVGGCVGAVAGSVVWAGSSTSLPVVLRTVVGSALFEVLCTPFGVTAMASLGALPQIANGSETLRERLEEVVPKFTLLHLILSPAWALIASGYSAPIPGGAYTVPGGVITGVLNLPYLIALGNTAFSRTLWSPLTEAPLKPWTVITNAIPGTLDDMLSKYTFFTLVITFGGLYCSAISQVFNDKHGYYGVWPYDPFFYILPHTERGWWVDYMALGSAAAIFTHIVVGNRRSPVPVEVRRFLAVYGITMGFRGVVLPLFFWIPSPDLSCRSSHVDFFLLAALQIVLGVGRTCHDLIPSGHSIMYSISGFYFQRNLSNPMWKAVSWGYTATAMILTVAAHAHYSYDCLTSLLMVFIVWTSYYKAIGTDVDVLEIEEPLTEDSTCGLTRRLGRNTVRLLQYCERDTTDLLPAYLKDESSSSSDEEGDEDDDGFPDPSADKDGSFATVIPADHHHDDDDDGKVAEISGEDGELGVQ
eukprot:NODE_547_length_2115_cov_51.280736_g505_i0.p1 GENE.NODE_547_length_2115_cov_51.280736_g505_i0~~NODE_547_length_2115_cov_51.280736_g505_i0.p1  ORF type:complete len:524 (-),score=81.74 NODE_547_length_2115_cov_51.280736_g505_i0:435-2006(-)